MNMINMAQAAANDMNALVQMNDCSSLGLKRFEENLRLFALNQRPVQLEGKTSPPLMSVPGTALSEQDYADLIEELVADQARTWAVNRFVSGSVTNVSVPSRDPAGLPSRMAAEYAYDGFNGRSRGTMSVHFIDGVPDCMYFSDAPAACRTPSRKIIASYTAGVRARRSTGVASTPAPAVPAVEHVTAEPVPPSAVPAEPPSPPAPRRELRAVNYIQGIKDACLEVLTGGDRREPETSYCFCLSASVGSIPVSEADAQWLFENFDDEALGELERRYAGLGRRFASCRAQLKANSDPERP